MMSFRLLLGRLRLCLYYALSYPHPHWPHVRFFRFGIPLVLKRDFRTISTEADALAMLNSSGLNLPIPRLIDTIRLETETYTLMTRIPGESLAQLVRHGKLSKKELRAIIDDVMDVMRRLWTLQQPPDIAGQVMLSASGHGLPDSLDFKDSLHGPDASILDCYTRLSIHLEDREDKPWGPEKLRAKFPQLVQDVTSDRIAWVAGDTLRPHNILVVNGRLSGIIDWEDSGWLPLHWQLHGLRIVCMGNLRIFSDLWKEKRFPDETERAFESSKKLLRYLVV